MTHRLQHIAVLQSSTLTKARLAPAEHVAQARDSKGDEATHSYVQTLKPVAGHPQLILQLSPRSVRLCWSYSAAVRL